MTKSERLDVFIKILRDLGIPIDEQTTIMDLGCGAGRMVQAGRAKGLQFYGCGFELRDDFDTAVPDLVQQGILRQIRPQPYELPFDDSHFDVVVSDQVLEHVMDYPTTLREIHRVLKPGGAFLHIFPARYKLVEPHIRVPLASVLRAQWWLKSWASIGIRNRFQQQLSVAETSAANTVFLTEHTNYLPKRTLRRLFSEYYTDVQFVERVFLKHSKRGRKVYELSAWLPFLPLLYSAAGSRVAFGKRSLAPVPLRQDRLPIQPTRDVQLEAALERTVADGTSS